MVHCRKHPPALPCNSGRRHYSARCEQGVRTLKFVKAGTLCSCAVVLSRIARHVAACRQQQFQTRLVLGTCPASAFTRSLAALLPPPLRCNYGKGNYGRVIDLATVALCSVQKPLHAFLPDRIAAYGI